MRISAPTSSALLTRRDRNKSTDQAGGQSIFRIAATCMNVAIRIGPAISPWGRSRSAQNLQVPNANSVLHFTDPANHRIAAFFAANPLFVESDRTGVTSRNRLLQIGKTESIVSCKRLSRAEQPSLQARHPAQNVSVSRRMRTEKSNAACRRPNLSIRFKEDATQHEQKQGFY